MSETVQSGSQQRVGRRTGTAREHAMERGAGWPDDTDILDWLDRCMKRKGAWHTMHLSDSRDMGYKRDFLSFCGSLPEGKGNSAREAIGAAMVGAGWKRSCRKPRHAPTDKVSRRADNAHPAAERTQ